MAYKDDKKKKAGKTGKARPGKLRAVKQMKNKRAASNRSRRQTRIAGKSASR